MKKKPMRFSKMLSIINLDKKLKTIIVKFHMNIQVSY